MTLTEPRYAREKTPLIRKGQNGGSIWRFAADRPVFLHVLIRNTGAVRLYRRMGFQMVRRVDGTRCIMEYKK